MNKPDGRVAADEWEMRKMQGHLFGRRVVNGARFVEVDPVRLLRWLELRRCGSRGLVIRGRGLVVRTVVVGVAQGRNAGLLDEQMQQ